MKAIERGGMSRNGGQCCGLEWSRLLCDIINVSSAVWKQLVPLLQECNAKECTGILGNGVKCCVMGYTVTQ